MKETIIFTNKGTKPVNVSWLKENNNQEDVFYDSAINFEVVPDCLVLYVQAKFDIRIDPKKTGHVRNVLKFYVTNHDYVDCIEVYVRGYIEPPRVIIEPSSLLLLGNVCIGTLIAHNINLKSWMHENRIIDSKVYCFENNNTKLHLISQKSSYFDFDLRVSNNVMGLNHEISVNTDVSDHKHVH